MSDYNVVRAAVYLLRSMGKRPSAASVNRIIRAADKRGLRKADVCQLVKVVLEGADKRETLIPSGREPHAIDSGTVREPFSSTTGTVSEKLGNHSGTAVTPTGTVLTRDGNHYDERRQQDNKTLDISQRKQQQDATSLSPERFVVFEAMRESGVTEKTALELATAHDPDLIRRQIESLPNRKADDPAAVLVASIKGNWEPVASKYQPVSDVQRKLAANTQAREAKWAEEEALAAEDQRQHVEATKAFEALPDGEREALTARARAIVESRYRNLPKSMTDSLIADKAIGELRAMFGSFASTCASGDIDPPR